jgi:hypothetical protein
MLNYGIVVRKDMDVNEHKTMYMYFYVHTLRRKKCIIILCKLS